MSINEKVAQKAFETWQKEFADGDIEEQEAYQRSLIAYEAAKASDELVDNQRYGLKTFWKKDEKGFPILGAHHLNYVLDKEIPTEWIPKTKQPVSVGAGNAAYPVTRQPVGTSEFDQIAARKDLKPEALEVLREPLVQSLLYDINLLPEQITQEKHWFYMLSVLSHMEQACKFKREVSAQPKEDKFIISEMWMAYVDGKTGSSHTKYAAGESDENAMRNILALLINKGWKQP